MEPKLAAACSLRLLVFSTVFCCRLFHVQDTVGLHRFQKSPRHVMPTVNASLRICNLLKVLLCPSRFRKRCLVARLMMLGLCFLLICQTMIFYPARHSNLNEIRISFALTPSNYLAKNASLAVFVLSAPKNTLARATIRKTWAHRSNTTSDWGVVFLLGKTKDIGLQRHIERESEQHGDILQGSLPDTYHFLLLKVLLALKWAKMMNVRYVVKTDDDIYVNIPMLLLWFQENGYAAVNTRTLYAGKVLKRSSVGRYNILSGYPVSREDYSETHYPPYCMGALYLMSNDLVQNIVDKTSERPLFPVEDAYIGVVAKLLGVTPLNLYPHVLSVHNKNRWSRRDTDECTLPRYIAIGDGLKPSDLIYVHAIVSQPMKLSLNPRCDGSVLIAPHPSIAFVSLILSYVFLWEGSLLSKCE